MPTLPPCAAMRCSFQVCWSPFSPSHFLTASADWSVRLWSEGQPHSLWTFQLAHSRAEVADVAFCPAVSTLFAAAAGNSLQLWDVERSVLAPRALGTRLGVRLTALAFSKVGGPGCGASGMLDGTSLGAGVGAAATELGCFVLTLLSLVQILTRHSLVSPPHHASLPPGGPCCGSGRR